MSSYRTTSSASEMQRKIVSAFQAIENAHELIRQYLDGPLTMHDALDAVKVCIEAIDTEADIKEATIAEISAALGVLRTQRDDAYRERDRAIRAYKIANETAAFWNRVAELVARHGNEDLAKQIRYLLSVAASEKTGG
jgi:uncharacterized membrane protein YccC